MESSFLVFLVYKKLDAKLPTNFSIFCTKGVFLIAIHYQIDAYLVKLIQSI